MQTQQMLRTSLHCGHVQRVVDPPELPRAKGQRRTAAENAKQVTAFNRAKPRVPIACHLGAANDGHRVWLKVKIERL